MRYLLFGHGNVWAMAATCKLISISVLVTLESRVCIFNLFITHLKRVRSRRLIEKHNHHDDRSGWKCWILDIHLDYNPGWRYHRSCDLHTVAHSPWIALDPDDF